MALEYNDPINGDESGIGSQIRTDLFKRKALVEAAKERYFGQIADVTAMPKNTGKTIKQYHYLPLLDDANINDQGLDGSGVSGAWEVTFTVAGPNVEGDAGLGRSFYFTSTDAVKATAFTAVQALYIAWAESDVSGGGLGLTTAAGTTDEKYIELTTTGGASAFDLGYLTTAGDTAAGADAVSDAGNLYGSSKDVGTISGKLPALTENGGEVNRVGFKRIEIEGTIDKFGFYDSYTEESLNFDSDAELEMHIIQETVKGANEMTEDALQIDLLNGAGVIRYAGIATSDAELTGVTADTISSVSYEDLMRLAIDLDNNRCPKKLKRMTGTRYIDTQTIDAARVLYIGSELIPSLKRMEDFHNNPAFIPVQKYAAGTSVMTGEIGSVDQFRIVVVPEMMHWAGEGAAEDANAGYRVTGGNYDVFPLLCVGEGSFTTIGFQTDGKTFKFKTKHSKPGSPESYAGDPYGETGFYSIKWYYGTMILRSERIALIKCVAEY